MNVFDFVNDITTEKRYILDSTNRKYYVPFLVNRALSQSVDTLLIANYINTNSHLDLQLQHDMYWYSIKKRPKKYQKWPQKNIQNLNIIMLVYKCSEKNAVQILKILTEEQLAILNSVEDTLQNATSSSSKSSK